MNTQEFRSISGLVALYATRMLGLFMVLPVLTLYIDHYEGGNALLIGIALGVYGLTQGILQIPFGLLSDKIGRKTVIIGGMLIFLLGSLVAANAESVTALIAGRALQGAGAVASAIMALLSDLTTEENRTKAMAAVGGSIGLSFALAMVVGPILASRWGLSGIFWLTSLMAAIGVLLVVFWIPTPNAVRHVTASETLAAPGLLWNTLKNTQLLRLNFGVFTLHMAQMASWISVPYFLKEVFHLELSRHWMLYLLTMGIGFIAMLPLIILGERRHKLKQVFLIGVAILAVAEVILYQSGESLLSFAFGMFSFFTGFNLMEATLPSLVSKIAPSGTRGTAMGLFSSSQFLGAFFGGSVGGYIALKLGYQAVFIFASMMLLLWFAVAATMAKPRHWGTVVVDMENYPQLKIDNTRLYSDCQGIEEITLFPDQQLLYLKVDKKLFSQQKLDELLESYSVAETTMTANC